MSVPKLRFKEFDGDWASSKLGELIGISSASRVFKEQWQESGVPFYRTSDVISIFKNKKNERAYISWELFEELAKKSGKIQKDDLLVTGGGTIGIPYLIPNDEPLYFKDADLLWLKSSGVINGSFLYNFFISSKFREYLKSISHTGTISHFTIEQAKETPFQFPSFVEQTKIASFLSAVDEKISLLTKKHELLSQYKQGMMQKLFSQQIRFKADDGSEFGEWETLKFKDLINIKYGKDHKKLGDGNIPVLGTGGIMRYVDSYLYDGESILIGRKGTINKPQFISGKFWTVDTLFYTEIGKKILPKFAFQQLLLVNWLNLNEATGVPSLNTSSIGNIEIKVPCLDEQTKIANFLSAIDQKIEVVVKQIEQAKQWKKGLLQQMFV